MQSIIDFLTFQTLISPYILILFYIFGAIGVPVGSWYLVKRILNKSELTSDVPEVEKTLLHNMPRTKSRLKFGTLFISLFLMLEIFWRMMFEFLIVYFQIRDALMNPFIL